jgi:hypothetical protein
MLPNRPACTEIRHPPASKYAKTHNERLALNVPRHSVDHSVNVGDYLRQLVPDGVEHLFLGASGDGAVTRPLLDGRQGVLHRGLDISKGTLVRGCVL